MKIVVSACLMGESCKYNGLDNYHRELVEACERTETEVLLVCPEVFGGLPTPRKPSEIVNGEVRTCGGRVGRSRVSPGRPAHTRYVRAGGWPV